MNYVWFLEMSCGYDILEMRLTRHGNLWDMWYALFLVYDLKRNWLDKLLVEDEVPCGFELDLSASRQGPGLALEHLYPIQLTYEFFSCSYGVWIS